MWTFVEMNIKLIPKVSLNSDERVAFPWISMTKDHPPLLLFSIGRHKKLFFSESYVFIMYRLSKKITHNKWGRSPKKQTNNTQIHTQYLKYPENQPLFKMIIPQTFLLKMNQIFLYIKMSGITCWESEGILFLAFFMFIL